MCFSGGAILAYVVTDGRLFSHKTGVWLTLLGHRGILLRRVAHGRKIAMRPLLFPGYVFVCIISRGQAARWMPGVVSFVMGGECRRACPDALAQCTVLPFSYF
jgi:transcription antitermination factor NusG